MASYLVGLVIDNPNQRKKYSTCKICQSIFHNDYIFLNRLVNTHKYLYSLTLEISSFCILKRVNFYL